MMKFHSALTLAASMALAAGLAHAAPAPAPNRAGLGIDSTQPIAVNADSFLADLNGETGTYTGNVIVTQGAVKLHADEVKVVAPGGRASRMEAQGHVVVDSPSGKAVGDSGIYEVAQQVLRLNGNVVLTKEANVMRGSSLEVSMATGIAKLSAGGQAQPGQPSGRVQGLFVPAQKPGAAPPANPPKP